MTYLPQLNCLQSHSNYLNFYGPMEYDISIFALLTFLKIPSILLLLNSHIFNECFASVLNIPLFIYTGIYVFLSLLIFYPMTLKVQMSYLFYGEGDIV